MKKILLILVLLVCCFLLIMESASAQNIGINATGAAPAASSMLDVSATDKGLLIPRVALTATNVAGPVTAPTTSLLIYNTATAGSSPNNVNPGYYYWSGTVWIALLNSASNLNAWNAIGNSGTTAGTNFIGTTDNVDLVVKTNNSEKARFTSAGNVGIGTASFDATNPEKLLVDVGTTTSVNAIYAKGTVNNYLQLNIQNLSSGTQSSSDLVATANNGTETTNFVDLGINGSAYSYQIGNPIETGKPNDGYLISAGNDFYVVNNNVSKDMLFLTGGTASTNERMRILSSGNVGIGNVLPGFKLDVNGTIGTGKASTTNGSVVFSNSTNANSVTFNSGATTTSYTLTLPVAQGAASTVLVNNGSGVLTWNTLAALSGSWSSTGNSGTSSSTNFLGTTDNQALSFRVNNQLSGKIETSTTANTAFGYQSGQNNTGTANTSFGSQTLQANTSGANNTAFGSSSLKANLTGSGNTGVGASALLATTGSSNTAVGGFAMQSNVGGSNNAALGNSALSNNTSGTGNTAVGSAALQNNVSGINNTAIGNGSFQLSTQGNSNTSVGAFALQNNNLGGSNSGLGYGALSGTVAGNNNTGLGYQAGSTNTSGGNNTFVGYQADATSNNLTNATAVGYSAKVASSNSLILGGTGANAVNVGIGNNVFDATNPEKLLINAGTTSSVNILAGKGSINSYLQLNIQNQSNGTTASSDVVATADNGSESTNYINMGINSSTYTGGVMGAVNDSYLYNIGQNLLIGTGTAAKSLVFVTGGTSQSSNERMRIDGNGNVGIGTPAPGNKLEINSGTGGVSGLRLKQLPAGGVLFMNSTADVAQNNSNFYFDATNYRLSVAAGSSPNSTLQVGGSIALGVATKTANYTASISDHTIICNNTSGAITISLPPAAGASGRVYVIKKISGPLNDVIIDGSTTETIDGALTMTLSTQYNSVMIQTDGSNWFVLSKN